MVELTPEEQAKAIAEAPKGTWAILLVYAVLMVLGWLYMFYGFFFYLMDLLISTNKNQGALTCM